MKKILIIKSLNSLTFFLILVPCIMGVEIFYFHSSSFFLKSFFIKVLEKLSIKRINYEDCDDLGVQPNRGKIGDFTDQVLYDLLNSEHIDKFNHFFDRINDVDSKLSLLVKKFIMLRCDELYTVSIWLNGVSKFQHNHKIYLLWDICSIGNSFVLKSCQNINIKILAHSNLFIYFYYLNKGITRFIKKMFFLKQGLDDNEKQNLSSVMTDSVDTSSYEILFFPHSSIFYGDLFIKNYFYSEERGSVFNIKNILHIEFSRLLLGSKKAKFYSDNNIKTVLFPKPKIKEYFKFFKYAISSIGFINSLTMLKSNALLFSILLVNSIEFLTNKKIVNLSYGNAKIALVGYEILFPPVISLVFESLSIKTVAVQERFLASAFYENYPFILDTYYVSSSFTCKMIKESKVKFVNRCIPCGQLRTDLIEGFKSDDSGKNNLIIVFDYHSVKDPYLNMRMIDNNWLSNKSFYDDICKLAKRNKDFDFVIRGKNLNWTEIPYFEATIKKINSIPNLRISSDYKTLNMQYKMASNAKLIIAKHSSIGDELIASGKSVIYHDFQPNVRKGVSVDYDYNKFDNFAYSFHELELKVKSVLDGNHLSTKRKLIELQEIINNGASDGKAKDRVITDLKTLYGS